MKSKLHLFVLLSLLISPFSIQSQSFQTPPSKIITTIEGKWYNLSIRNEYLNGGIESGSTGDSEPIRINEDGTWSYYGKKRMLTVTPFTNLDAQQWNIKSNIPIWKITLQDFSNGDGNGYITTNEKGEPLYLVVKFKIYTPKEGHSIWIQYRKG